MSCLLPRQQRHRKERAKAAKAAAEDREAATAIRQQQREQHERDTKLALDAGLAPPAPPPLAEKKRRAHHSKEGSLRNHRTRANKRQPQTDAPRRPRSEDEAESDSDEGDGSEGNDVNGDDPKQPIIDEEVTAAAEEDDPNAAVYSFVPITAQFAKSATESTVRTAPRPSRVPESLHTEHEREAAKRAVLLATMPAAVSQRDELDELLQSPTVDTKSSSSLTKPSGTVVARGGKLRTSSRPKPSAVPPNAPQRPVENPHMTMTELERELDDLLVD